MPSGRLNTASPGKRGAPSAQAVTRTGPALAAHVGYCRVSTTGRYGPPGAHDEKSAAACTSPDARA